MRRDHAPLLIAAVALAVLPFVLDRIGLPLRTSIDVVLFAIACLGLNVLVGYTGLVSFGHGAWFGLGAYAAALTQKYWFSGGIVLPFLFAILFIATAATLAGALILRRRGVYFSLLTLALTALLFAVASRWTNFTGGESGLGHTWRKSRARRGLLLGRCHNRVRGGFPTVAFPPLTGRARADRDPRKRAAGALHRVSDQPLQAARIRDFGDRRRPCRCALGLQPPFCLRRAAGGGVFGRAHRHGHHRRDAQLLGAGARGPVLHSIPRVPVHLDAELV